MVAELVQSCDYSLQCIASVLREVRDLQCSLVATTKSISELESASVILIHKHVLIQF